MTAVSTDRYDLAITLPTGFRSAGAYSLVLEDDAFYVIRLSGALGPQVDADAFLDHTSGVGDRISAELGVAMAQPVLKKRAAKYATDREAALDRLEAKGARAMADEKGSYQFARGDLKSLETKRKGAGEVMVLKTRGRSFAFRLGSSTGPDLRAFLEDVRAWAGL